MHVHTYIALLKSCRAIPSRSKPRNSIFPSLPFCPCCYFVGLALPSSRQVKRSEDLSCHDKTTPHLSADLIYRTRVDNCNTRV